MISESILVFETQPSYWNSSLLYVFAVQVYKVLKNVYLNDWVTHLPQIYQVVVFSTNWSIQTDQAPKFIQIQST